MQKKKNKTREAWHACTRIHRISRNCPKEAQMLDLLEKAFTSATINMFKELKETVRLLSHQIQNINRNGNYEQEPNRNSEIKKYN
jgi:hypothetical protein